MSIVGRREPITPLGKEFDGNTWCSTHIVVGEKSVRLQVWNNGDGSEVGVSIEDVIDLSLDFNSAACLSHVLKEAVLSSEKLHDPEISAIRSCASDIQSRGCNCASRKPEEQPGVSILRLGGHHFDCPQAIARDLMRLAEEKAERLTDTKSRP